MRETIRVGVAVALIDLFMRGIGVLDWISSSPMGRLPWLLPRYALIFPALLFLSLIVLRRLELIRTNLLVACLAGCVAGTIASLIAVVLAQVVTEPERSHFLNTLGEGDGLVGFLLTGTTATLLWGFSWLYGSASAVLAILAERVEYRVRGDRKPASS